MLSLDSYTGDLRSGKAFNSLIRGCTSTDKYIFSGSWLTRHLVWKLSASIDPLNQTGYPSLPQQCLACIVGLYLSPNSSTVLFVFCKSPLIDLINCIFMSACLQKKQLNEFILDGAHGNMWKLIPKSSGWSTHMSRHFLYHRHQSL